MRGNYKAVIPQVERKLRKSADESVKQTALEAGTRCVLGTPVDTGACKAHWFVGNQEASGFSRDVRDQAGGGTISRIRSTVETLDTKRRIYISNTAPYCIYLERGWSSQQPAGWITNVRIEMRLIFKRKFVFAFGQA